MWNLSAVAQWKKRRFLEFVLGYTSGFKKKKKSAKLIKDRLTMRTFGSSKRGAWGGGKEQTCTHREEKSMLHR